MAFAGRAAWASPQGQHSKTKQVQSITGFLCAQQSSPGRSSEATRTPLDPPELPWALLRDHKSSSEATRPPLGPPELPWTLLRGHQLLWAHQSSLGRSSEATKTPLSPPELPWAFLRGHQNSSGPTRALLGRSSEATKALLGPPEVPWAFLRGHQSFSGTQHGKTKTSAKYHGFPVWCPATT